MKFYNGFMTIRLIATGGTFDKVYDPIRGALAFDATHLHRMVERARLTVAPAIETPMLLDSLEMSDSHRQQLLARCAAAAESRIVIVHGTDTMSDSARVLGQAGLAKTIVLAGAMVPYDIAGSDALFNLGFAIGVVQLLSPGVYVAMNGQVHLWSNVRKNRDLGRFEPLG